MSSRNNMFTLHDRKAELYNQPFYAPTDGAACRMIEDTINANEKGDLAAHPEDFVLYRVGQFNADTGEVTPEIPKHIIDVATLKK